MNLKEAIKTLDEVIPQPLNKMVDIEHLKIAVAWRIIKEQINNSHIEVADFEPITHFFQD